VFVTNKDSAFVRIVTFVTLPEGLCNGEKAVLSAV
jgi:hypothetical protein